ncbi:MAG: hypothetical protein ACE5D2_08745, partial [Fidelibacterota bacterium]
MQGKKFLRLGAVLLILLGVLRGTGGLILLIQGPAADPNITATAMDTSIVASFLILIGLLSIIFGIGLWKQRRKCWIGGIITTIAFVIDGAINGFVLYGQPGDKGTVVNLLSAVIIITILYFGRAGVKSRAQTTTNKKNN